jgi:hypothetical protein
MFSYTYRPPNILKVPLSARLWGLLWGISKKLGKLEGCLLPPPKRSGFVSAEQLVIRALDFADLKLLAQAARWQPSGATVDLTPELHAAHERFGHRIWVEDLDAHVVPARCQELIRSSALG